MLSTSWSIKCCLNIIKPMRFTCISRVNELKSCTNSIQSAGFKTNIQQTFSNHNKLLSHSKSSQYVLGLRRNSQQKQKVDDNFIEFFKFPYIVILRTISRFKIYQTGFTITSVPIMTVLCSMDYVSQDMVIYFSTLSVLAIAMLIIMTRVLQRAVGILSVSRDMKQLKVSHLTFWGRRRNVVFETEDVIPISETSDSSKSVLRKLGFYGKPEYFYYSLHFGGVTDKELFEEILGNIYQ